MRYLLIVIAFALMLTQSALPAPEKQIIRVSRDPLVLSYDSAVAMGFIYPPMFLNVGQTLSGNPVLIYYGELDLGAGGTVGKVDLWDGSGNSLRVTTPSLSGNWTLTLPPNDGDAGYVLQTNGGGTTSWVSPSAGSGTVAGNGTDHHIARWDGTDDIQDSDWVLLDSGNLSAAGSSGYIEFDPDTGDTIISDSLGGGSFKVFNSIPLNTDPSAQLASSSLGFGPGSSAPDAVLLRAAADVLGIANGDALRLGSQAGSHASTADGTMSYNTGTDKIEFLEDGSVVTIPVILDDLADVNAPTPSNGDVLTWDSTPGEAVFAPPATPTDNNTWAFSLPVGMENNTSDWNWDIQERVTGLTIPALTYTTEITFTFDKTTTPASATTSETFGRWRWTSQDLGTDVQGQVGIGRSVYRAGDDLTITFRVKVSLTARLESVYARISDGTNSAVSSNQIGSMSNATWHEFSITQDVSSWGSELRIVLTAQGTRTGANMGLTLFDFQSCLLEWS